MATIAAPQAAPELPPPLVRIGRHPLRWFRIKGELLVAAVVLAHVGVLVVAGLYYLLFEVNASMTHFWHRLVTDASLRHSIRDVGEGVLGGFLAQAIVWNHYKHRREGLFDRAEKALHLPAKLGAPLFALLYGVAGAVVTYYVLRALGTYAHTAAPTSSTWARLERVWASGWDKKIVGFVASFVARRPMRPLFDAIQLWFAEHRVARGQRLRWYHPPTFRARYNDLVAQGPVAPERHGRLRSSLMVALLALGIALAGYGFYVLTFVAGGG